VGVENGQVGDGHREIYFQRLLEPTIPSGKITYSERDIFLSLNTEKEICMSS